MFRNITRRIQQHVKTKNQTQKDKMDNSKPKNSNEQNQNSTKKKGGKRGGGKNSNRGGGGSDQKEKHGSSNKNPPTSRGGDDNSSNKKEAVKSQTQQKNKNRNRMRNRDENQKNHPSNNNNNNRNNSTTNNNNKNAVCPAYWKLEDCLTQYNAKNPDMIRGTLRVLPARDATSFCTCDRGSQKKDVVIEGPFERNRALDGDIVYVQLLPYEDNEEPKTKSKTDDNDSKMEKKKQESENERNKSAISQTNEKIEKDADGGCDDNLESLEKESWWQDDPMQMKLWAPAVPIQRKNLIPKENLTEQESQQRRGRVVFVVPPKNLTSEIQPTKQTAATYRKIVGSLKRLQSGTTLLNCTNKSLPQFRLSDTDAQKYKSTSEDAMFQAKYVYGSWPQDGKWPPCADVNQFGRSCNIEDETMALLITNNVDHGDFPQGVLSECGEVVASGEYSSGTESGWKPIPEMYKGRRDYRKRRIFTIDPTTAKDLDDALHIEEMENGQIEIGVHIADVSHFIQPNSAIDVEARRRCTTVYLVDRTIPMLPRPLCEIACSLNENVERLAFSCVWKMNRDGSIVPGEENVWYGRTVIKSCARLDYATAQNIIDNKVACGENYLDEDLWPESRRPTGGHTIDEVAADVKLMNQVAQARRQLRFRNGALALNSVKLTFQLDGDRETPLLCQPYVIRDSNKLVEEYMLLANYLVAQRLITHAGKRACLRHHEPPLNLGLEKVAQMAKESIGFDIDISSSEALQRSLNRLGREFSGNELVIKCITEMLKMPMKPANYIAAGEIPQESWSHFALNIPYYTHFTSPIRRYADVMVHRLLQATIDGEDAVQNFPFTVKEIGTICGTCNEKKDGSRKAQERSDVVFLALYLKRNPMKGKMGIVLSVGMKAFTVFIPSMGISALVYLEEHKNWISFEAYSAGGGNDQNRRIKLVRIAKSGSGDHNWKELVIKNFTKIRVTCKCQEKPPITVKLALEGPWTE